MTSRKRNSATTPSSHPRRERQASRKNSGKDASLHSRMKRRQHLLETLESRQLLAGPQLIGIQPNEGDLIVNGSVLDTAPRVLTFGFDEVQQINPDTLDGIRVTRSGDDGVFNTSDDVRVAPGLVTVGDPNENEVVVRFAEALPDDSYRIEVFGFDDANRGIIGLQNRNGEFLQPSVEGERSDVVEFELKLGALIESIVPQPVVRLQDGSLHQNRNEIVVYFNEDPLFVENDDLGNPTERSAENPRFYQLLLTQESVRTTDDLRFHPERVVYDQATSTARLFFASDINNLPGVPQEGGTWRLRVGTAVDDRVDLILPPTNVIVSASAVSDFQQDGLRVTFFSQTPGEADNGREIRFVDNTSSGLVASLDGNGNVVFDFGGASPTFRNLQDAITANPLVSAAIGLSVAQDGIAGAGLDLVVPSYVIGAAPIRLNAVGETLGGALDVGVFGAGGEITSLVLSESIDPKPYDIQLPGADSDPGHRRLINHINSAFGADTTNGITEIPYNFDPIYETQGGNGLQNQITDRQKTRVREVLQLWADRIGVQFRETADQGITFAAGEITTTTPFGGTIPRLSGNASVVSQLNSVIRINPDFINTSGSGNNRAAIVFSNEFDFGLAYGEDFTRKAAAGVGLLLGLQAAVDLPPQSLAALNLQFLTDPIDPIELPPNLSEIADIDDFMLPFFEPVFPANIDVQHAQHLYRPDGIDIDLYRFEVNLGDADQTGTLIAETIAERLPDASELDTTVTLFQETAASASTDFGLGSGLQVEFESLMNGPAGNHTRIDFIRTDRPSGDPALRVSQSRDTTGNPLPNSFLIDIPRGGGSIASVSVGDVIDAINTDPIASSVVRARLQRGSASANIIDAPLTFSPILLQDGGLVQLSRNDDYFSEDSRVIATLGQGTYYIGVAASGNDSYDPSVEGSSFGGVTQGPYDLKLEFRPQVDEVDVIRDLDSDRANVPGTRLDGDGDGTPGGVMNFWFQTRPVNRRIDFLVNGDAITVGQVLTVVGSNGTERRFEFVEIGSTPLPGNVPVFYSSGATSLATPAGNLASSLLSAINGRQSETGVSAIQLGTTLEFTGEQRIEFSTDFRGVDVLGRNIFVDKSAGPQADGSLAQPFNNINNPSVANAFGAALPQDIVRIVGNGGSDLDITTEADNFAFLIGVTDTGGQTLEDGRNMEVPQGVTTMIDAGVVVKLRSAFISVGSNNVQEDLSGSALQVLGTPRLLQLSTGDDPSSASFAPQTTIVGNVDDLANGYDDGSVIFTSTRDREADAVAAGITPAPGPGDWGGLIFRRDIDQAEGRRDFEDEGIFLQHVNHAEIRYGGSSDILIGSVQQLVNPIQLANLRPNISFNEIRESADAAISAAPNSFEESSFAASRFQQAGAFTPDYDRVGPAVHNNSVFDNSINGLFIRSIVSPTSPPSELTVSGRLDDIDITHFIAENLVVAGNPGGSITDEFRPSLTQVSGQTRPGGTLAPANGQVQYRMTFLDRDGFESASTLAAEAFTIAVGNGDAVELTGLPTVLSQPDYVSRRLYRAELDGSGTPGAFILIADLDGSSQTYFDDGSASDGTLDTARLGRRGRLDASLVIDPGTVLKLQGARIELGHGTQLLAEGLESQPVIFTSSLDDRYGAGGTFDTNNDNDTITGEAQPQRGNWAGIYASPGARVSLDNAVVAYGGGISLIEGGQSKGFAALELHQADGRVTNSRFEFNEDGQGGSGARGREGRLAIDPSTIFVRGSQPIIIDNDFVDNHGTLIEIDVESLTSEIVVDTGRQTFDNDRFAGFDHNKGPLVRMNRYENVPGDSIKLSTDSTDLANDRQISGLGIRGGELMVATVFDDADIVHVVRDSIIVGNLQSDGGLLLKSQPNESLVVKLEGPGTPNSPTFGTGITATGANSDTVDRIGGFVHVIGLPGAPVVLTSLKDDTIGAGLHVDGSQFTDTNGDSFGSRPEPNDWRSILLDQFSNDRNVDFQLELEAPNDVAPGRNGRLLTAQVLGELATDLNSGDESRRLGFHVAGYLSTPQDIDTYSFTATTGSEVWIDVDRTSLGLDTVIELLDANGNVLARSDNSFAEIAGTTPITIVSPAVSSNVNTLQSQADDFTNFTISGLYDDQGSLNDRDAGFRLVLPGNVTANESRNQYFFRIRSASTDPDNANGGQTRGQYEFQVRLQEEQEYPGSVVRYADIRFANHGVHVRGLPGESPLLGEAQENESVDPIAVNDVLNRVVLGNNVTPPIQRPQNVGNLLDSKSGVISVAGSLDSLGFGSFNGDIDFYQVDLRAVAQSNQSIESFFSTIFDVDYADGLSRPDTNISVFYDPDGEAGPLLPSLVLFGSDSNVADDQTSPLGENGSAEGLSAGSISTGDPLIGPVSLPEGAYFVAITGSGLIPEELSSVIVRREPINSIQRLFEDRVEAPPIDAFGNPITGTASGPRFPQLFTETAITTGGYVRSTDESDQPGHGSYPSFDGSNVSQNQRNQTLYSEADAITFNTGAIYDNQVIIDDPGGLPITGFALDLATLTWSLDDNPQIGSTSQPVFGTLNGFSVNTSTTIPHVSIEGSMAFDAADFYQIVVPTDGTRVIIDVDEGFNPFQGPEDNDDLPIFIPDPNSIDVDLVIVNAPPSLLDPPARILTSDPDDGREGSVAATFVFDEDDLINLSADPFFDGVLNAGTYFIGVLADNTAITFDNGGVQVSNDDLPTSGRYVLHVSQEDVVVPGSGSTNESIFFDRGAVVGNLVAETFDLTGYVAEDLPRFYFNYHFDAPGDAVELTITSDQNSTGITQTNLLSDGVWHQNIVDLSPFAGDTNIQITFNYTAGVTTNPVATGLHLDDFIIGFAERGETIFNATGGSTTFTGFDNGPDGEYQLEIRNATDFGVGNSSFASPTRQTLTRDFDTNDRHTRAITLLAPAGTQISDGDTFEISDGRNTQIFEFDSNGNIGFDRTRVTFAAGDSSAVIAERMRDAINASARITVEAASSGGLDTETMTDNRINLFGAASGSFQTLPTFLDAPDATTPLQRTGAHVAIPAVLRDDLGDVNHTRIQSQVIIENNTISDVRAIGVWTEPGDRGTDLEDLREDPLDGFFGITTGFDTFDDIYGGDTTITTPHPFLELPPIGNPAAGVARNLPALNQSVTGGLMPGVVVRNNTVDQAGLAGVKVEGETRPFVIDHIDAFVPPDEDATNLFTFLSSIAFLPDGLVMAIDAGGTRVVFEFEDVSGADTNAGGSGTVGGDGYVDGHVPIFYRHTLGGGYNDPAENNPGFRNYGHNSFELMLSIQQAIQGSILVSNGMAELVKATLGPSLTSRSGFFEQFARTPEAFPTAAVYLEGVSNVYFATNYAKRGGFLTLSAGLAPVAEPAQPFARVVNNTVYGADGTESNFPEAALDDGNDLITDGTITHVGRAHTGPYIQDAILGDSATATVSAVNDVDLYQVELVVGDRLVVDVDTVAGGPDTVIQLFSDTGVRQDLNFGNGAPVFVNESGVAAGHLDPESTAANPVTDVDNGIDPFIDFTALESGTYYVAISSTGNVNYDPANLSGRQGGSGGTGDYQVGIEVYAPRSFVLSLDDNNENQVVNNLGTTAADVIGETFTITQIPDFQANTPSYNGVVPNTTGNQLTFEFTAASDVQVVNGNIAVNLLAEYRTQDIMRAIANAVTGLQDPVARFDFAPLPNHEDLNGPNGRSGPISRARALALGGRDGDNIGINNLSDPSRRPGIDRDLFPLHYILQNDSDFEFGFGHDRREGPRLVSIVPRNTLTDGFGTSELYVLLENIADIELSPGAIAAGLKLTPDQAKPEFADNADQLVTEHGIWVTNGASPTVLNNVLANLHQSVVVDETSFIGFGKRVDTVGDLTVKPAEVVLAGSIFQHDESRNSEIRYDLTWPVDIVDPFDVFDTSLSTDDIIGATNIADQADDFNFRLNDTDPLFVNPGGNNFLPAPGSTAIDSAINSVNERDAFATLKNAVGLRPSNILAPTRDVNGVLRADNDLYATPGGLGQSIFKDRGSVELADFVGPIAVGLNPRDNDAAALDGDPAVSFVQRDEGVLSEFQIQLVDTGDSSDPFTGIGIDDRSVVVAELPGARLAGANLTLFENDRLLTEGVDYTFSYDDINNIITLTPIAGVWQNDRSYRIGLNNQDRTVLTAPQASDVRDGDQFAITDTNGGQVVFEFESGYTLLVPEAITLTVPRIGTDEGGLSDGDIFLINDGTNPPIVFEFNSDAASLPGSVQIPLSSDPTPIDDPELSVFLNQIATDIQSAIQGEVNAGRLNVDVTVVDNKVVVGAEPGATATTSGSGLLQAPRTLALAVPRVGTSINGVADGDTFTISDGTSTVVFEVDTNATLNDATATPVTLNGLLDGSEVARIIATTISSSSLALNATTDGINVYLNLPTTGSASVGAGSRLSVVGLARTPNDGDTITFTPLRDPANPTVDPTPIVFEINRTDEPDGEGGTIDDGVTDQNIPINITRTTTADELAGSIVELLTDNPLDNSDPFFPIRGVTENDVLAIPGGLVSIGGAVGLGLDVTGASLEIVGEPNVTGASTIQVFGPLLLNLPLIGGSGLRDGTTITILDDNGVRQFFEFDDPVVNNGLRNPNANLVTYSSADDVDTLSNNLVAVINAAGIGITASYAGAGQVSLGRIDAARVEAPVILQLPTLGGAVIADEVTVTLTAADGTPFVFEFDSNLSPSDPSNLVVNFTPADNVDTIADNLVALINGSGLGITVESFGNGQISLGTLSTSQVDVDGTNVINAVGLQGDPLRRAIVNDQEVLTLRQGGISVSFEFESINNGGGVNPGNIAVAFQPGSTVGDVATSLAAAINNNKGGLRVNAVAELDSNGVATGQVFLNDLPGTVIDVSGAGTLNVTGVPGGAIPIRINPAFSSTDVKQALLSAINSVNVPGELPSTTLSAADRGGETLFVSNGVIFEGPINSYFLPGIKDLAGNVLEENRPDRTTQFTMLLPNVGLDYGDAPDPVSQVPGRYPTLDSQNGARHVVDSELRLGRLIDADVDGSPVSTADGDDLTIAISSQGTLFSTAVVNGAATITVQEGVEPLLRDGDTISIDTGVASATLEFDTNGRFDEDNFAIRPTLPITTESIVTAINAAIAESPLNPAEVVSEGNIVRVISDDEDGVDFGSVTNPNGVLNKGVLTPISVTVSGSGVVEAWIDFNVDGDWTDPGEQIISAETPGAVFSGGEVPITRVFTVTVPATSPTPPTALDTYARFRVSAEGGLDPTGLSLSGEVEDYVVKILPGSPPTLTDQNANRTFTVEEGRPLQALDRDGTLTTGITNDNGLLVGVIDPDGDDVAIIPQDVGSRILTLPSGAVVGNLTVASDGTFTLLPTVESEDFNGQATFTVRVTDVNTVNPAAQIVNSRPISVTINVTPVNDPPEALTPNVVVNRAINEDAQQTFTSADLIDPFYRPGPDNESDQTLRILSAGSVRGNAFSTLGGSISLANNGTTLIYTPPADYNGSPSDSFTYVVADVVPEGQFSESAATVGTVVLTIAAVNDPPRLTDDSYFTDEDVALTIPISGTSGNPGILDNDTAGPQDEIDAGQTILLQSGQFPKSTFRGGTVRMEGPNLIYQPRALFAGSDQFTYTVVDSDGLTAEATVSIVVGGVNNAPRFEGIDGEAGRTTLEFTESKQDPVQQTFNLTNWFSDPESDTLTFSVTSSNSSIVDASVVGDLLLLTLPPFAFGTSTLTVTARDTSGLTTSQAVEVTVENTPDAPQVIGSLNPLNGTEDQLVTADLSLVFADPDGQQLDYIVAQLDNLVAPTATQIEQHPLIQSIETVGNQLRIVLKPDQSGTADIELAATDGSQRVSDTFRLTISPVADSPTAGADGYNVPVGATRQVLNPADGLLRNDTDADGDLIEVDLATVTDTTFGTLEVNANGTFTYVNTGGTAGTTDSFTYQAVDSTGRRSATVTVSLNLNQSEYQNPIQDLESDVNADGNISAIDALRVINLLNRRLTGQGSQLSVREIGSPPPDYVDVDGNGQVTANDALRVINELNRRNVRGEGEFVSAADSASAQLDFASTTAFASASQANLPVRNLAPISPETDAEETPRDTLLAAGLEINADTTESAANLLSSMATTTVEPEEVDSAITDVLDDWMIDTSIDR